MITNLKQLYESKDSTGDIIIGTLDGDIKCHKFILSLTSKYLSNMLNVDKISIPFTSKLIKIVFEYLYVENIRQDDLTGLEIIDLLNIISILQLDGLLCPLKNYYVNLFFSKITKNNWLDLFDKIFNNIIYSELQKLVLKYFQNCVLIDLNAINNLKINDTLNKINENKRQILISKCLDKLIYLNQELQNIEKSNNIDISVAQSLKKIVETEGSSDEDDDVECTKKKLKKKKKSKK